jgi:ubiquinone/menaquinone biosynthesis C-methylase UbiE
MAPRYDAWYETPRGALVDREEKRAVLALAKPRTGERALDVGCGTGNYAVALAELGVEATGVDPAPAMLGVTAQKIAADDGPASPSIAFVQAAAEELPFGDAVFDLAVCVTVLEFVDSPAHAVAEMMRVVAPGGHLVAGVLNRWSLWAWHYRRQTGTVYAHAHFFSPRELRELLAPYGSVRWRSCVFIPPWDSGRSPARAALWERLGAALRSPFGAFLAASVEKSKWE